MFLTTSQHTIFLDNLKTQKFLHPQHRIDNLKTQNILDKKENIFKNLKTQNMLDNPKTKNIFHEISKTPKLCMCSGSRTSPCLCFSFKLISISKSIHNTCQEKMFQINQKLFLLNSGSKSNQFFLSLYGKSQSPLSI